MDRRKIARELEKTRIKKAVYIREKQSIFVIRRKAFPSKLGLLSLYIKRHKYSTCFLKSSHASCLIQSNLNLVTALSALIRSEISEAMRMPYVFLDRMYFYFFFLLDKKKIR